MVSVASEGEGAGGVPREDPEIPDAPLYGPDDDPPYRTVPEAEGTSRSTCPIGEPSRLRPQRAAVGLTFFGARLPRAVKATTRCLWGDRWERERRRVAPGCSAPIVGALRKGPITAR